MSPKLPITPSDKLVIKEIENRLIRHPGDAPWSCIDCYHNRPCMDKKVLVAALKYLSKL